MTTRFDAKGNAIPSGYNHSVAEDVVVPSCGVQDVDRAIFHLFDKELKLQVGDASSTQKANVVFATGERWAIMKKKKALRDKNGSLILPLITIGRTSVEQDQTSDITGRGINQQTGELVIQRRLHTSDRSYQNVINKLFIKNSQYVATDAELAQPGYLSTRGQLNELASEPDVNDGVLLKTDLRNNVWETITIPSPQFFTAKYDVSFWTLYTVHMTQLIDSVMAGMLPQGRSFKISNPNNPSYWFVATIDGNFEPDNSFDDLVEQERVIKCNFTISVPAYVVASNSPGVPNPVRRYVSSPKVDFTMSLDEGESFDGSVQGNDPFLGSDDPTLPIDHDLPSSQLGIDQRYTGHQRLEYGEGVSQKDPALQKLPRGKTLSTYEKIPVVGSDGVVRYKNIRISTGNRGETTYSSSDVSLSDLSLVVTRR